MSQDGRGWHGDEKGHREAALKGQAEGANNTPMRREEDDDDLPEAWMKKAKRELEKKLGVKTEVASDSYYEDLGGFALESVEGEGNNGESEWIVFHNSEDAEKAAVQRARDGLEEEPEIFNKDWLFSQIDDDKAEGLFREIYSEWDRGYAEDIKTEDSDEYTNRLAEEMVSTGLITEEEGKDEDFDLDTKIDEFVENMTNDKINEGGGGLEHYTFNFGEDAAKKILEDNNLIGIDSAAQDAVDTDGISHFLDRYDGSEVELPSGAIAYGTN